MAVNREVDLLNNNPRELLNELMEIIINGGSLTPTQVIYFEACRNILGIDNE